MSELQGIEFLKENIIEGKSCDLSKPFVFISYAHDEYDTKVVRNVFDRLYSKGYNLWIDTANIPKNENSWTTAAEEALMNEEETCKLALFFRSEESLIRKPIFEELQMIKALEHINRIVVIDIWHDDGMTAEEYGIQLIKQKKRKELNIYRKICEKVDVDSSVIRIQDVNSSLDELIKKIGSELKKDGVEPVGKRTDAELQSKTKPEEEHKETIVNPVISIPVSDGYTYKIFDKKYYANEREQGKLMYDAFSALTEKYPGKAEELTKKTSVARAEDVINANTKLAKPVYFRACRQFTVGEHNYYVGTSYSFDAKLAEIKGMFKICGADPDEFVIIKAGEENISQNDSDIVNPKPDECYVYKIFGKEYYANEREQGKLMYDAFSVLTEKYPEKVEELTKRTSIARAEDVTNANTKLAKPIYFKTCRQFTVRGHN
ncbi:MAG: toll/interleukin-1 receptor domain-containing protein, partial [Ruminococcus sp.]